VLCVGRAFSAGLDQVQLNASLQGSFQKTTTWVVFMLSPAFCWIQINMTVSREQEHNKKMVNVSECFMYMLSNIIYSHTFPLRYNRKSKIICCCRVRPSGSRSACCRHPHHLIFRTNQRGLHKMENPFRRGETDAKSILLAQTKQRFSVFYLLCTKSDLAATQERLRRRLDILVSQGSDRHSTPWQLEPLLDLQVGPLLPIFRKRKQNCKSSILKTFLSI